MTSKLAITQTKKAEKILTLKLNANGIPPLNSDIGKKLNIAALSSIFI